MSYFQKVFLSAILSTGLLFCQQKKQLSDNIEESQTDFSSLPIDMKISVIKKLSLQEVHAPQLWRLIGYLDAWDASGKAFTTYRAFLESLILEARMRLRPDCPPKKSGILTAMIILKRLSQENKRLLCEIMQESWLISQVPHWFIAKTFPMRDVDCIKSGGHVKNTVIKLKTSSEVYSLCRKEELFAGEKYDVTRNPPHQSMRPVFSEENGHCRVFDPDGMTCENMLFTQAPFVVSQTDCAAEIDRRLKEGYATSGYYAKKNILQKRYSNFQDLPFYVQQIKKNRLTFKDNLTVFRAPSGASLYANTEPDAVFELLDALVNPPHNPSPIVQRTHACTIQ